jgi:flagellar motor switch protein FliM
MDEREQAQMALNMTTTKSHRVLDARTLGRPVHLTDRFTTQIREELTEYFRVRFNRRYRAGFEIGSADLTHSSIQPPQRWLTFSGVSGCIGFALSREIVLRIQRYRYGMPDSEALEPENASEERLASMLGVQLANMVARNIESLLTPSVESLGELQAIDTPAQFPSEGCWTLQVAVSEPARDVTGALWFLIDEAWVARLLQGLAPRRSHTRPQRGVGVANSPPLPARLHLSMTARLLEKELPLGTVMDLQVGDVIPVSLSRADVMVGDSRLFSASVAEHKGKLCLTTFEDME